MQISLKLAVRCAVELCAITCPGSHQTLGADSYNLIIEKGIQGISQENINYEIDHNLAARLFSDYKHCPTRINNINLIKELLRKLWLSNILVTNFKKLSVSSLRKEVERKFSEEQTFDPDLTLRKFHLFDIVDNFLKSDSIIEETGALYSKICELFPSAFDILAAVFSQLNEVSYMNKIYSVETSNTIPDVEKNEIATTNSMGISTITATLDSSSKDIIRVLEKDKHNLELKLQFMKKDTMREIISTLTDATWGAPLNELFLLSRSESTPEKVRGAINNLFMALRSVNVKLVDDRRIGTQIVLTPENQDRFDPFKNEEIFLSDEVVVLYPGYRFDREIMVKPVVRRKMQKEDD